MTVAAGLEILQALTARRGKDYANMVSTLGQITVMLTSVLGGDTRKEVSMTRSLAEHSKVCAKLLNVNPHELWEDVMMVGQKMMEE